MPAPFVLTARHSGIRVSSRALKMGSSVFEAMLGGSFRESDLNEIPLPEDDFDCMLAICEVVHMRHSAAVPDVDWLTFYELSDKYDVVAAMAPVALTWMENELDCINTDQYVRVADLHRTFAAAVGFNGQRTATRLGRELVNHAISAIDHHDKCSEVVPAEVYSKCMPHALFKQRR